MVVDLHGFGLAPGLELEMSLPFSGLVRPLMFWMRLVALESPPRLLSEVMELVGVLQLSEVMEVE